MTISPNKQPKGNAVPKLIGVPLAVAALAAFTLNANSAIYSFQSPEQTAEPASVAQPLSEKACTYKEFSDSLGLYKGQTIVGMRMSPKSDKVQLLMANGTKILITKEEFEKLNIELPPPPPPAPPVPPVPPLPPIAPPPPPPPAPPIHPLDKVHAPMPEMITAPAIVPVPPVPPVKTSEE